MRRDWTIGARATRDHVIARAFKSDMLGGMQPSRYSKFMTWSACAAISVLLAACSAVPSNSGKKVPPGMKSSRSSSKSMMMRSSSSAPARLRPGTVRTSPSKVSVQAPKPSSSRRSR